jgi:hypothetical protein
MEGFEKYVYEECSAIVDKIFYHLQIFSNDPINLRKCPIKYIQVRPVMKNHRYY